MCHKKKSKEYIYNYVDRVRFAEGTFPDYKCPSRGSGWRHNKSVSHLDLATSCHSAASGLNHWSSSSQHQSRHQLRHSRSLDYNHIDRCKDALDIAEYYWRLEPEPEVYDEEEEEVIEPEHTGSNSQQQLKYVSEHHLTQHYRDFKCADENYHHSANNIYQTPQQLQQQQQHQQQQQQQPPLPRQQQIIQQHQTTSSTAIPPQAFEFGSDSCSLRRSRSLAVIREETFSDLQISSSNGSRRSQLIPRARLVNRGYFRERERLICGNNKHHHHHHTSREKLANCNNSGCSTGPGCGLGTCTSTVGGCFCQEPDEQSNESIADTCDSHQHQLLQLQHHKQQLQQKQQQQQHQQQQQQQQQHLHYHPHYHDTQTTTNDYYEHLKRLDKLALGLVTEQLHPWHNDKSDLESLNSDYFKNSLHQTNDLKHKEFEFESLEHAVNLLSQEKPRIYQSRRQKRSSNLEKSQQKLANSAASGAESCPENSQSSVFPETTTSNSDDQTDSASLSEQEYDITKIEEIFQKTHIEGDDESYEIISLTTTRTRFETTEDEGEEEEREFAEELANRHRLYTEFDGIVREHVEDEDYEEDEEPEGNDTEESNRHTTTDTEIEGTLKRSRAVSENLQKIIAYDSVYLSSEESSDSTLIDIDNYDTSLEVASLCTCIDEIENLLHISIEDAIYEPKAKQHKIEIELDTKNDLETSSLAESINFVESVNTKIEILEHKHDSEKEEVNPVYTQILKVEHTPNCNQQQQQPQHHISSTPIGVTSSAASKPKILSVVEKRKLKRYSDSAYSSNVSDSSEKGLTHANNNNSSQESHTYSTHIKRQVAEPIYIPLKSNLSDNQYHSLPDVNISQILKDSESIDAQLRSSYHLDNYRSLDDAIVDCHLHESDHKTTLILENHYNNNNRKQREDIVTSEQIYDSIKRFGRAHQKYRQKECKQFDEEQARAAELNRVVENKQEDIEDKEIIPTATKETKEILTIEQENSLQSETQISQDESSSSQEQSFDTTKPQVSYSSTQNFDSLEKSKDAPGIEIENFSQQIERRAKEIRNSGRRTHTQHIEFANRAKFRLENTFITYPEEEQVTYNRQPILRQSIKNSTFRIVVTDAQNNIIEEDSIESQENFERQQEREEEKENQNIKTKEKSKDLTATEDLLMYKFCKERLKDRTNTLNTKTTGGSLKRAPSKPKRQQYPTTKLQYPNTTTTTNQHLSIAETKKLLLSPKTKERRVISNQIYRARPVKVITTTTTTTTTDSFRRNKVKHNSNKMSRPQILQVIDNKRKLEMGNLTTNPNTTFNIMGKQKYESNQVENEYLKKVDAVRCYWSKLVNEDTEQQQQQQQQESQLQPQYKTEKLLKPLIEGNNEKPQPAEAKEQKSFIKQSKETNDMENLNVNNKEKKQFILGSQDEVDNRKLTRNLTMKTGDIKTQQQDGNLHSQQHHHHHQQDDYSSFMPSIEIVELEGDKKATIVSAAGVVRDVRNEDNDGNVDADDDANEPQFDHIRYKILKSQQLLRSNVLARNKKEAQFDGLIQYLQEYSFQELLSNNNVVIVEPVRTKIERPFPSHNTITGRLKNSNVCKTTATTTATSSSSSSNEANKRKPKTNGCNSTPSGGIKRHFFYQPVRVNRELYEEELPNPDTVRNVRKFFEEHILPTPGQGLMTKGNNENNMNSSSDATNNGELVTVSSKQTSPKSRRARKYRYLTIDTSYGHAATTAAAAVSKFQQQKTKNLQSRKWDTASLSSGISSGDLSSPCECNETEVNLQRDTNNTTAAHTANDVAAVKQHTKVEQMDEDGQDETKGVHVQDIVKKHNSCVKKSRSAGMGGAGGFGIPVRSSGIRPRSAVYGSMHKTGKSNNYRDIYEYHLHHQDSDQDGDNDEDDDGEDNDNDLFGDLEDDEDELCNTYYVSNDVLRKIRECGSSVTYYGGRVVQTSATATKPLETYLNGNNGQNAMVNNATMTLQQPTMMTQTQTRARVREIETCCNAANECQHHSRKQFEQKKLQHLMKYNGDDDDDNNKETIMSTTAARNAGNNVKNIIRDQGYEGGDKADCNGGVGITFKLVKSNSCSSRLELAGTTDNEALDEPEDTEVVRKMVHHFETSSNNNRTIKTTTNNNNTEIPLTINNQATVYTQREVVEADDDDDGVAGIAVKKDVKAIEEKYHDFGIKQVTVNNHINVAKGNLTQSSTTTKELIKLKRNHEAEYKEKQESENEKEPNKTEVAKVRQYEEKLYQTEAKDIFLDNTANVVGGGGAGAGTAAEGNVNNESVGNNGTCVKICRNKNVDLAFTLVKQQQPTKSLGISQEIDKIPTHIENQKSAAAATTTTSKYNNNNPLEENENEIFKKCVIYENTLLPTITAVAATTTVTKNSNKMSTRDLKVDEAYQQELHITTISSKTPSTTTSSSSFLSSTTLQTKPSQIIVPVEIHRIDTTTQQNILSSTNNTDISSSTYSSSSYSSSSNKPKGVEEKSFLPLSTTSSVTSVIDKTVVKHYVANDKSIYEKRKYDDIEFEEFEIYDPTKDFEKLIEEEKLRNSHLNSDSQLLNDITASEDHQDGQQFSTSTTSSSSSMTTSNSTMMTAKSQPTNLSTETETDCYDSLDDKL